MDYQSLSALHASYLFRRDWHVLLETSNRYQGYHQGTSISLWMIEIITLVLAEVYTVPQDWGNLFFKLSLAETHEEVATSITEEAWLYNECAIYIGFDNIHRFHCCPV